MLSLTPERHAVERQSFAARAALLELRRAREQCIAREHVYPGWIRGLAGFDTGQHALHDGGGRKLPRVVRGAQPLEVQAMGRRVL